MNHLNFYSQILIFVGALVVSTDCQCSCTDMALIKQLLQQEMFERKLEISKLRSELQTTSNDNGLIATYSTKDINARVETLERRFSDFENATNIKEKRNAGETESKVTDIDKTLKKKNLEIQSMMRKTLKEEKTERLKFFNSVKNQIEKLDERVSQFMNTTDASLNEQIRKSESGLKEIRNEVSDIRESIDKEVSAVDKGIVDDVIAMVKKSTTDLTKLQGQLKEHLKTSDSRFGTVGQIIGACPGGKWQRYGDKWYQFYNNGQSTWFEARETCRSIGGELARIGNKRENNFIKNTIKRSYPVSYWFGLHDTQSENFWQWSSSNGTYSLGKFSNWAPDEPNNAFGNEDCSVIWGNGEWNDIDCSLKMTFICETFLF